MPFQVLSVSSLHLDELVFVCLIVRVCICMCLLGYMDLQGIGCVVYVAPSSFELAVASIVQQQVRGGITETLASELITCLLPFCPYTVMRFRMQVIVTTGI